MSNLLNVIFENEVLREKVKVLLVEHRYYKEARELMENKNEGIFNAINPKATVYGCYEMKTKPENESKK